MPKSSAAVPSAEPAPAWPDAVQSVSDRLLARVAAWQTRQSVPQVHSENRVVPGVDSPRPTSFGMRDELRPLRTESDQTQLESASSLGVVAQVSSRIPSTVAASIVADPVARTEINPTRPSGLSDSPDELDRPVVPPSGATSALLDLVVGGESAVGEPLPSFTFDRPQLEPDGASQPLAPPVANPSVLFPSGLGARSSDESPEFTSSQAAFTPFTSDPPSVRPQRPDAFAESFGEQFSVRPGFAATSGDQSPSPIPTDEEVFATAVSGMGPVGGSAASSGSGGVDMTRTNELLQQIVDALRKQASRSNASLPGGGNLVYSERS